MTLERELKSLRAQGYTVREIAERCNVSTTAVYYWLDPVNGRKRVQDTRERRRDRGGVNLADMPNSQWQRWLKRQLETARSK